MASIQTRRVMYIHSNLSLHFLQNFSMGDLGVHVFSLISPWLQGLEIICRSSSSKVIVGNGGLNSKVCKVHWFCCGGSHIHKHRCCCNL